MKKRVPPPRWFFAILEVGGFIACGIYIGISSVEGATIGNIFSAFCFGVFGLFMLWGILGKR